MNSNPWFEKILAPVKTDLNAVNEPFTFADPTWPFTYEKRGWIDLGKKGKKK